MSGLAGDTNQQRVADFRKVCSAQTMIMNDTRLCRSAGGEFTCSIYKYIYMDTFNNLKEFA